MSESRRPVYGYVVPFVAFVTIMALERMLSLPLAWAYTIRFLVVSLLVGWLSWPYLSFRPSLPLASIGVGAAVFVIWIGPDLLFGPGYRHLPLFENAVLGAAASSAPPELRQNVWFLAVRILGTALLVPIVEELFWRGWMMRWLIDQEFLKVPLGTYAPGAFWLVAVLFASEHGSYWDVGLVTGVIYNWWVIRTRNLADCVLAHGVTNALLAAYVVFGGHWQYWL
jgi:uncharacterized protein